MLSGTTLSSSTYICSIDNPIFMKLKLLICTLFIVSFSYAQDYMENAKTDQSYIIPVATNFKTYGYIAGRRLDSVDAVYATIDWRPQEQIRFDYGQIVTRLKEY